MYSRHHRVLGYRLHRYRIPIALAFILPTIAGNIILWKSPRDNKAALLGGLYIVRYPCSLVVELTIISQLPSTEHMFSNSV